MTLLELNQNLKKYANHFEIEKALFRFLKENSHLILQYNVRQLFSDSIGADGISLGFYSYNTSNFQNDASKAGGTPFTMVKSGDFLGGMYAKVLYRKIILSSSASHLEDMVLSPAFDTVNFFGLTEENLVLLKRFHTTPFIRQWLRQKISS